MGGPPRELGRVERPSKRPGRVGWVGGTREACTTARRVRRPTEGARGVGRPSRRVGRGLQAHSESREHSRGKEEYVRPSWRDGSGRKAFLEGRKSLGEMIGVGRPPEGSGSIGSPIRRAMRGREDLSKCLEGSVGPYEGPRQAGRPGEVRSLSQRAGRHPEALPKGREGSGGHSGGLIWSIGSGWVWRPSWRAGRGREALP